MGVGDNLQHFTDLDKALDRYYDLHPKQQFTRLGKTARWFRAHTKKFTGKAYDYRAFIQPSNGVRVKGFAAARIAEFPIAQDMAFQDLSVTTKDLKVFQGSVKFNEVDELQTMDRKHAIARLSLRLVTDIESDFGSKINMAMFQPGTAAMALVSAVYDVDGTEMTGIGGAHAAAYVKIKSGSIAQFNKGDVLDFYDANTTTKNITVVVLDVVYGKDGPWNGTTAAKVPDIGPGLICEPCAANGDTSSGTGYDTNWSDSAQISAYGDYADSIIARSGEYTATATAYNNIHGFPDWMDPTINVYRIEAGTLLNRDGTGNQWSIPEVYQIAEAGSEVAFDPDTHFREVEDTLPDRVETGRNKRPGMGDGTHPKIKESMLAPMRPELLTEAVRTATDVRFTATAKMTLDATRRRELFGEVGFDGFVYHSATLGEIAFQVEPAMKPNSVYVLEPNSWFWVTFDGAVENVKWLRQGGERFARMEGDTNRTPTYYRQGAAHTWACLQCDQIAANWFMSGVKSSV